MAGGLCCFWGEKISESSGGLHLIAPRVRRAKCFGAAKTLPEAEFISAEDFKKRGPHEMKHFVGRSPPVTLDGRGVVLFLERKDKRKARWAAPDRAAGYSPQGAAQGHDRRDEVITPCRGRETRGRPRCIAAALCACGWGKSGRVGRSPAALIRPWRCGTGCRGRRQRRSSRPRAG